MADDPAPAPDIDGRGRDALREHVEAIAPHYVDDWDPDAGGVGSALVELFAELGEDVTERLDRVPGKHRVSFLDTLGFERRPPQASRLPLAFEVADGADGTVPVPAGTEAIADAADGRPEQSFVVGDAFEATPASLERALSVDPGIDGVFEHGAAVGGDAATTLFEGDNQQSHALYLGHAGQFEAGPGATITLSLAAAESTGTLLDNLVWEYYGERGTEAGGTDEGWHPFEGRAGRLPLLDVWAEGVLPGELVGTMIAFLNERGHDLTAADAETLRAAVGGDLSHGLAAGAAGPLSGDGGRDTARSTRTARVGRAVSSELLTVETAVSDADVGDEGDLPVVGPAVIEANPFEAFPAVRTLELSPGGTITETAVAGTESRWIRARLPLWYRGTELFDLELDATAASVDADHPVRIGPDPDREVRPDRMLHNDVPIDPDDSPILPFGSFPRRGDAFYLASSEILAKAEKRVRVTFEPPAVDSSPKSATDDPEVSWEYYDGSGWSSLDPGGSPIATAEPATTPRSVTFEVPPDLEPTTVSGHEGHWIRARLVGGDYGRVEAYRKEGADPERWTTERNVAPPTFGGVRVGYAAGDPSSPPEHVHARNNLTDSADLSDRGRIEPFTRLPDDEQALYLGFDAPLEDGPVSLLFSLADVQYPRSFRPGLRWEYCADPATDDWARLGVEDGTEGLTERGLVRLVFPEPTGSFERFGESHHWIRARVDGQQFGRDDEYGSGRADGLGATGGDSREDCGPDPCGERIPTAPPAGRPRPVHPPVEGIHPNATWGRNARPVADEVVGASDGTRDQTFAVASPPVLGATVWVDESQQLTEGQREDLRTATPDRVRDGDGDAFWVRWEEVPELLESGRDDRHYTLAATTGEIAFGDGSRGKIPPRGTNNVEVSYETGGGADGNVGAGAVTGLAGTLPLVDGVSNPEPADGGADAESREGVLDRGPKELRDRGRAVAPADFERIALDAARKLARAECFPAMDGDGAHAPGWVTLLIVPSASGDRPLPSATLRRRVERAVSERAPATLVDPDRLVVRGPSYVTVGVRATLAVEPGASASTVEEAAIDAASSFLDPLSGAGGGGWAFGELPCRSDFFGLLEGVDGVDHVEDLALTYAGEGAPVTVREGDATPSTSADALVASGVHEIGSVLDGEGS